MSRAPGAPPRSRREWERDEAANARERFARHELRSTNLGGHGWVLYGRDERGRWVHDSWFQVAVLEACVVVQGDIDLAAWEGFSMGDGPADAVARLGRHEDIDYVAQKATRSLGDLATEFCAEVLERDLRDLLDDREFGAADREAIEEAISDVEDAGEDTCRAAVQSLLDADVIDSDTACGMGEVTSHRVIVGHAAVARLAEVLARAGGAGPGGA